MVKLLLYVMCTAASLLVIGVITAADDRLPGVYNVSETVPIDDRMDYIDHHNYAYVLKRHRTVHVANSVSYTHLTLPTIYSV